MRRKYLKQSLLCYAKIPTTTTSIIKVRVSANLIASNLSAKPDALANLHKGMLTNHTGNKQPGVERKGGENVSRIRAGTLK